MLSLSSSEDPIIRLDDYYFSAADLVYVEFEKLWLRLEQGVKLSENNVIKFQRFLQIWLGMLYVVIEGFEHPVVINFYRSFVFADEMISVHWGSINHQISQLGPELKIYRNATFHYQNSMNQITDKRLRFLQNPLGREPIRWARTLHKEMQNFFGKYRSEAFVRKCLERGRI